MTNFEYMKQRMVAAVMLMNEMELLQLAEDTEMSASGAEGVFNCTICEKEYGECDSCPCTSEHNKRYLEWCKKERISQRENTRPCIIKYPRTTRGDGEWQNAFFHMWIRGKDVCGKETLYAVVEKKDGHVMKIEVKYMRFIDRSD